MRMEITTTFGQTVFNLEQWPELRQRRRDKKHKAEMNKSKDNMAHFTVENIAESMIYAMEAPDGTDISVHASVGSGPVISHYLYQNSAQ
ncbi:MAG: hypothetical protein H6Q14_1957 [Bacteroidetes bacterium]|jgi:hypothetical protein|nr:hypothetical protein [Bacteroidota bacterium]